MAEKMKQVLKVAGADKVADWDKYFGIGLYGAILSLVVGIIILAFPGLIAYVVGVYLVLRGILEILRYSKRKSLSIIGK